MRGSLSHVFVACCACVGISSIATAQRLVAPPPSGRPHEAYRNIYFASDGVGYAASDYVLLRTTDNGATWTHLIDTLESQKSPLVDVFFLDGSTFWIYGSGGFYRTGDGGNTIEKLALEVPQLRDSSHGDDVRQGFFFVDSTHGWAFGRAQLLITDDGGKTWRQQALPKMMTRPRQPSRLWFFDRQTGLAIGAQTVFRTEDGGKTWSAVPGSPHIDKLSCTGQVLCVGLFASVESKAYVSSDAGKTWRSTDTGMVRGKDWISAVQAIGSNDAVIAGSHVDERPSLLRNVDPRTPLPTVPTPVPPRGLIVRWNGTSWQRHEYPEIGRFWAIHFVTSANVWASADTNGILHSTDGGQTWTFVPDYYRRVSPPTPTWFVPFWPLPTPVQ